MICCINCFKDTEIRAAIEMIGHIGDCPVCRNRNTWIYESLNVYDTYSVDTTSVVYVASIPQLGA